ncbi:hypothetical protein [Hyphomicrobium sp.]|uniref:hypothetical protein n=1 Tax=Hyphomicrobium sp. TaxID=82 RepID=UPI0025B8F023|nr:hypothetical protein [Hyphomicrobium sp.]MCC7252734.1 hypothetical protein [Hyphomicrobium sp.]
MDQGRCRFWLLVLEPAFSGAGSRPHFAPSGDTTVAPLVHRRFTLSKLSTKSGRICDIERPWMEQLNGPELQLLGREAAVLTFKIKAIHAVVR